MAILTRRRLQSIINDLFGNDGAASPKRKDIVNRLNNQIDPKQTLGAEYELIVLWMLRNSKQMEIEPEWCAGASRPDAYTDSIFRDGLGELSEITAIGNGRAKEEDGMRAASRKLVEAANKIEKGVGAYLHFTFNEEWEHINGRRVRIRQIPTNLEVTPYVQWGLQELLKITSPQPIVRLKEGKLDVLIQRKTEKQHSLFNFHSSVPPEAKSITDNPIYDALKKKRDQLKNASENCRKVIWLCDAGADMLRAFGRPQVNNRAITATEIVEHFLQRYHDIDLVCILSPQHGNRTLGQKEESWWQLTLLPNINAATAVDQEFLNRIVSELPKPRFAGYQARELVLQGAYSPKAKGWYSGMTYRSNKDQGAIEVSSRLIIDLLARRITPKQFTYFMGDRGDENLFARLLDTGLTFSDITFRAGGIDDDDDKIILHYSKDPSAASFE